MVAPSGTVVVGVSVGTVVDVVASATVVLVLAVPGRREGPPASVVVGALVPFATVVDPATVEPGFDVATVVPVGVVVVVVGVLVGALVTQGMFNCVSVNTGRRYTWPVTFTSASAWA